MGMLKILRFNESNNLKIEIREIKKSNDPY